MIMSVKKRVRLRVMSLSLAAVFMMNMITPPEVYAAAVDYDAKIAELEKKAAEIERKNKERQAAIEEYKDDAAKQSQLKTAIGDGIAGLKEEIAAREELIRVQQAQIDAKIDEIEKLDKNIADTEEEIERKIEKIAQLERENDENLKRFGEILAAMYMTDDYDAVSLLAGSSDFFDLLIRTEVMQSVSQQNLKFMNDLTSAMEYQKHQIEELDAESARLEETKVEQLKEKSVLESERTALEKEKERFQTELTEKQNKYYTYATNEDNLKSEIGRLRSLVSASNDEVEAINKAVAEAIREQQRARENAGNTEVYSSDGFLWPLDSQYQLITTHFGYDAWRSGNHYGIDVGNSGIGGAPIYAAQSGTVMKAYNDGAYHGGYGNYVSIDHGGGISTLYAHGKTGGVTVSEGDYVEKGQVISHVGATGWATGNHLHFEVRVNGTAVNPFNYHFAGSNF
ncbi:peptidase M23 [Clostridia bacterium]|nr:peptidase M23 [Clostridia bacterium]